jgi:hypothetical protein
MNSDLVAFLEHARAKGMDHGTIRMLLLSAGWKEKDVARALAEHALDLPVPAPPDGGGARDAFLYLSAFAALYASAIATVSLLFDYVNRIFPDPARAAGFQSEAWSLKGMRWSLATLLVAFPVFLWQTRFLLKEMAIQLEKSWSAVRRWLTYLTLFVAAVALASDLVTLVFYFLEGELSIRFLLKVGIVCFVSGLAFAYYLATVRMPARVLAGSGMHRRFGVAATALAVVTLVWGVAVVGSPGAERLRKLDERRVQELRAIESSLDRLCLGPHTIRKEGPPQALVMPLPVTLAALASQATERRPSIVDPGSGAPYEYKLAGPSSFELCATFDRPRDEDDDPRWNHPAGRHCFTFDLLAPE